MDSVFAGYINIDLIKTDVNPQYDNYVKLLLVNAFIPTITLPTRITDSSLTLIDHIFIRLPKHLITNKTTAGNLYCDISDHLPNICIVQGTPSKQIKYRPLVRLYCEKNYILFTEKLKNTDFNQLYACNDANAAYNFISDKIQDLHNLCFPQKRLSRKKFKDKPWINKEIKKMISHKNIMYRQYIKNPSEQLRNKMRTHKAILKRSLTEAQSNYYKKILDENLNSAKKAWSVINSIVNNNSQKNNTVPSLNHNGTELKDPSAICNAMNEYFSTIGEKLANNIQYSVDEDHFLD